MSNLEVKSNFNPQEHLNKIILPYWNSLRDDIYGGFYGFKSYDLKVIKNYEKGVILHSRILWFYSSVYMVLGGEENLSNADHAFDFIINHCIDKDYGGVSWMINASGSVKDRTKNTYNQAFSIYGLSAYYKATGNKEALRLAYSLFGCIESYCRDEYGYLEAFSADWKTPEESAICDQGVVADKSMNTLLHILEAYTELYSVDKNPSVYRALVFCLKIIAKKVYNKELNRLETFFDKQMNPLADIHSYGHDIEASWLLDKAISVLTENDETFDIINQIKSITLELAEKILSSGYDGIALNNECRGEKKPENQTIDTNRIWWVQAETVVGFINAWQKTQKEVYLLAASNVFKYIENNIVDKRSGSEWFWSVDKEGIPSKHGITEPWKCPYHNGRMCLELIKRGF